MTKSTVGARRRFLERDVVRLEQALQNAWVVVSGDSPLLKPSITTCWAAIEAATPAITDCVSCSIAHVLKVRQSIWDGDELTDEQLYRAEIEVGIVEAFCIRVFKKSARRMSMTAERHLKWARNAGSIVDDMSSAGLIETRVVDKSEGVKQ